MALKKNLAYVLIILLSFLMMPFKSFGESLEKGDKIGCSQKQTISKSYNSHNDK